MRQLYLLLLGVFLFAASPTNAQQTYTQGDILLVQQAMMNHDSTICASTCNLMYNITIQNSFMGDSVKIVDITNGTLVFADGNMSGQSSWNLFAPVPINPYVGDDQLNSGYAYFMGPTLKVISGTDTITNINNFFSLYVPNPCTYGDVLGQVYIDNNSDCSFNAGDEALSGIGVYSAVTLNSPAMSSTGAYTTSDLNGHYNLMVLQTWLTSYTVSIPSNLQFIFPMSPCAPGSYTFTTLPQVNVDFPLLCSSNVDIQCAAVSPGWVRPNIPFFLDPFVSNTGCDTISGQLMLIKDSHAIYNASLSSNPATTVSGDTLTWNYASLSNISNGAYWNSFFASVHLTPDASVNIGDSLCFRVIAAPPANDVNAGNNDYSFCLPVVNSYDPNAKEVSPKGTGTDGNIPASTPELTYTIHFQNTGTAMAYTVSIIDTLDGDVQLNSLKILGTSHQVYPEWLAPGIVRFNFYNINLPDSLSNEAASHGSVMFSVKLDNALPIGTQIKNTAHIYFDSNPAIVTNTALNTIGNPSGVTHLTGSSANFNIYPNPAFETLFVAADKKGGLNDAVLTIQNMAGQVMLQHNLNGNQNELDISRLPVGMYLVRIASGSGTVVGKLLKQ
jgi:hypothetical protein